jgi:hypothetical protein
LTEAEALPRFIVELSAWREEEGEEGQAGSCVRRRAELELAGINVWSIDRSGVIGEFGVRRVRTAPIWGFQPREIDLRFRHNYILNSLVLGGLSE